MMAYLATPIITHCSASNRRLFQSFNSPNPSRKPNGSTRAQLDFEIEKPCESGGRKMAHQLSLLIDRRTFISSVMSLICVAPSRLSLASMPGDPNMDIEDVTPPIAPTRRLPPAEERIVELFGKMTYSVVNIFDVTLRPQVNLTGSIEVPEGNGSGIIWDKQGHIVTNYHGYKGTLMQHWLEQTKLKIWLF